ncbi:NAC domain-containing 83-like [Olea europaea subsp. europaea]|uniref:NAC domain-containing 83-like n=1 Tax=Olea europaea subsp. europaea TaxID=158383 RepID=A0A8S0TBU1_OLEEU|nr:NAC domain-containing 83-like [Olea europaea subsp. europaea]
MEKTNAGVGNGDIELPIGFRFRPTDEELLLHYLIRKIYSLPLPATVITQLDVFSFNPWDLPGDLKEKRYFFSKRNRNVMNKCSSFSAGCGYWKATGQDSQIMAPGTNRVIGMKKSLVFYKYNYYRGPAFKTQWVMHQYCIQNSLITPRLSYQKLTLEVGDWVVCCIYQQQGKRKGRSLGINNTTKKSRNSECIGSIILSMGEDTDMISSQCSSGITEISCADDLYLETSSH